MLSTKYKDAAAVYMKYGPLKCALYMRKYNITLSSCLSEMIYEFVKLDCLGGVEFAIDQGAYLEYHSNDYLYTPTHYALVKGKYNVAKFLLDKGGTLEPFILARVVKSNLIHVCQIAELVIHHFVFKSIRMSLEEIEELDLFCIEKYRAARDGFNNPMTSSNDRNANMHIMAETKALRYVLRTYEEWLLEKERITN